MTAKHSLRPQYARAALIALAADRVFYRPLRDLPTIYTVIASFGVALIFRAAVQLIWGTENQVYSTGFQKPMIFFDTLRIATRHIQIIIATAAITLGMHLFLSRTRTGKSMRAVADDPELAAIALDNIRSEGVNIVEGAPVAQITKSGDDITRSVLTQIIVEEEAKGQNLLPIGFLRQLIGMYGDSLQDLVPKYLEHSMGNFVENQEQMREYLTSAFDGMFPFGSLEDMSKQNMTMMKQA